MTCDVYHGCGSRIRAVTLLAFLVSIQSGCALLQPSAPPPESIVCTQQDREIVRLQQTLAEKDAEIQKLHAQQNVQATALEQTTGEAARAEVKLRRLATQADAASHLAEVEVALQGMWAEIHPQRAATQLAQAQRILDAGAASFVHGDYGAAVELAAQSQEIIKMAANGRRRTAPATRVTVEVPFQVPVDLRTRRDSNLRAHPGNMASVLDVLRQGTPLQAQAYRGEWLRVRAEDGREGWVYGPLLEAPHPAAD